MTASALRIYGSRTLAALAGVLMTLIVGVSAAQACSCVAEHPATRLASAEAALVGVVESRTDTPSDAVHVIRVERAVKGTFGERVTVHSGMSSCQVRLEAGSRVGLFLTADGNGEWSTGSCLVVDADALLAAAELPAPNGGTARFVAAVEGIGPVTLTADGKIAAYALPQGDPTALARCGAAIVAAARRRLDGKPIVSRYALPQLWWSPIAEVPLRDVRALACAGDTTFAAGSDGVVAIRDGRPRLLRRIDAAAVALTSTHAYFARPGALKVVSLADGRVRTIRHAGRFRSLTVSGRRVSGPLAGGRHGVLDLTTRRLRTSVAAEQTLLSVDGTTYLADGGSIRRRTPGAGRATVFARLPGKVVALTRVPASAAAARLDCPLSRGRSSE